ncbi:MAG: hypothetical protein WCI92_14275 [Bacteroidota bacterium]
MRIILLLSLILSFIFSNAQDRKDTIRMKDGTEILCQIVRISEPDSVIQFCTRENGELKVMKIQTAFVDSYSWPGKEQADKYAKMLGAKTIHDGEIYKEYWRIKPPSPIRERTSTELATKKLNKGSALVKASFAVISAGMVTAIFVPKLISEPSIQGSNMYSYPEDFKAYENTVRALQIAGIGVMVIGAAIGLSSVPHFKKAKLLRQEPGKGLSISTGRDGLCLAFKL